MENCYYCCLPLQAATKKTKKVNVFKRRKYLNCHEHRNDDGYDDLSKIADHTLPTTTMISNCRDQNDDNNNACCDRIDCLITINNNNKNRCNMNNDNCDDDDDDDNATNFYSLLNYKYSTTTTTTNRKNRFYRRRQRDFHGEILYFSLLFCKFFFIIDT